MSNGNIPSCSLTLKTRSPIRALGRTLPKSLWKCPLTLSLHFHLLFISSCDVSAARKCQKILGKNASLWEYEVYKFKEIGQLKVSYFYLHP